MPFPPGAIAQLISPLVGSTRKSVSSILRWSRRWYRTLYYRNISSSRQYKYAVARDSYIYIYTTAPPSPTLYTIESSCSRSKDTRPRNHINSRYSFGVPNWRCTPYTTQYVHDSPVPSLLCHQFPVIELTILLDPTAFAASQISPKFSTLVNAMRGRGNPAEPTYMTVRERIDFAIIILEFGALTGV